MGELIQFPVKFRPIPQDDPFLENVIDPPSAFSPCDPAELALADFIAKYGDYPEEEAPPSHGFTATDPTSLAYRK